MDILETLEKSGESLYIEDLDFFETELATGEGYDAAYIQRCMTKIHELRIWKNDGLNTPASHQKIKSSAELPKGLLLGLGDVAPKENNPTALSMKPEDIIFRDIESIRRDRFYKKNFKQYVAEKPEIDAAFIDRFYSFFKPMEIDAIVSVKPLGEEFLEKYFGAINHNAIARYQLFSENFFMKHFAQLDASVVLEHGKNEWRKKENRSSQLDVFLRLKGVKI